MLDRIVERPEAFGLPGDRALLRVLFVGDLFGNRRLAVVAGVTGVPRLVNLTGGAGRRRKAELTGWSDVEAPVVHDDWRTNTG